MNHQLKKARLVPIVNRREQEAIEVLFNPADYSLEKGAEFQATALPGMQSPVQHFTNGQSDTLSMELFFDTYTDGGRQDVTEETSRLAGLLDIESTVHAPPLVRFEWGKFHFTAVIQRLSQKFTLFLEDGTPVRATLGVTFKEYKRLTEQILSMDLQSADRSKRRVVTEGDSLWMLAAREYGDAGLWPRIAEANDIDDPRRLEVGRELRLPPLEN